MKQMAGAAADAVKNAVGMGDASSKPSWTWDQDDWFRRNARQLNYSILIFQ